MSIFLFYCVSFYPLLVPYTLRLPHLNKYINTPVQYVGLETTSVLTSCLLHESTENSSLIYNSWCGILIMPSGFLLHKGTASPNAHRASRSQPLASRSVQCYTIVGIGDISGIQPDRVEAAACGWWPGWWLRPTQNIRECASVAS